jgi:hypothetical protein
MAYIKETLLIFCILYTVSILALDPDRKHASDFATFQEYKEYLKEYNKEKRDNRKEAFAERVHCSVSIHVYFYVTAYNYTKTAKIRAHTTTNS